MAAIESWYHISWNRHSWCIGFFASPSRDPRKSDMELHQRSRSKLDLTAVIESPYRISRFRHSCCLVFYSSWCRDPWNSDMVSICWCHTWIDTCWILPRVTLIHDLHVLEMLNQSDTCHCLIVPRVPSWRGLLSWVGFKFSRDFTHRDFGVPDVNKFWHVQLSIPETPSRTRINDPDQSLIWRLRFHRDFSYCYYALFSFHFKYRAGSPRSNSGQTLCLDMTIEICLPLQRSEILLLKRFFSNFLSFAAFDHSLPSIIHCFRSFTSLNLSSVCLSITNLLFSCHLHCCHQWQAFAVC